MRKFSIHLIFSCNPRIRSDAGLVMSVVNMNLRDLNPKIEVEIRKQFPEYSRRAEDEEMEVSRSSKRHFLYSTHFDYRFVVNCDTEHSVIERILGFEQSLEEMLRDLDFYLGDFMHNIDYHDQPVRFDSDVDDKWIDDLFSEFDREHILSFLYGNKGVKFTQEQLLDELSKMTHKKQEQPKVISSIVSPKRVYDQFMFRFSRNLMMMADERLLKMQSMEKNGEIQIFFWVEN